MVKVDLKQSSHFHEPTGIVQIQIGCMNSVHVMFEMQYICYKLVYFCHQMHGLENIRAGAIIEMNT